MAEGCAASCHCVSRDQSNERSDNRVGRDRDFEAVATGDPQSAEILILLRPQIETEKDLQHHQASGEKRTRHRHDERLAVQQSVAMQGFEYLGTTGSTLEASAHAADVYAPSASPVGGLKDQHLILPVDLVGRGDGLPPAQRNAVGFAALQSAGTDTALSQMRHARLLRLAANQQQPVVLVKRFQGQRLLQPQVVVGYPVMQRQRPEMRPLTPEPRQTTGKRGIHHLGDAYSVWAVVDFVNAAELLAVRLNSAIDFDHQRRNATATLRPGGVLMRTALQPAQHLLKNLAGGRMGQCDFTVDPVEFDSRHAVLTSRNVVSNLSCERHNASPLLIRRKELFCEQGILPT